MSKAVVPLLLLLAPLLVGCGSAPEMSEVDRTAVTHLHAQYGDSWEFSVEDVYLRARYRRVGAVPASEAEEIFRTFWIADGHVRRDSGLVYLNIYDESNRFSFQLFWDPRDGAVRRGSAEHY